MSPGHVRAGIRFRICATVHRIVRIGVRTVLKKLKVSQDSIGSNPWSSEIMLALGEVQVPCAWCLRPPHPPNVVFRIQLLQVGKCKLVGGVVLSTVCLLFFDLLTYNH